MSPARKYGLISYHSPCSNFIVGEQISIETIAMSSFRRDGAALGSFLSAMNVHLTKVDDVLHQRSVHPTIARKGISFTDVSELQFRSSPQNGDDLQLSQLCDTFISSFTNLHSFFQRNFD
jgi:hypothetical protein